MRPTSSSATATAFPAGSRRPGAPGGAVGSGGPAVADGGPLSVPTAAAATDLQDDAGRAVTLQRQAGRAMARKLLGDMGMREHRLRTCGYTLGAGRTFRAGADGKVRSVGVEKCGNARACPVCGPAVAAVRGAETGAVVWRWLATPTHGAIFVSIAASHRAGDRLEDLHEQLLTARSEVMRYSDVAWRRFRARFGVADIAVKVEHSCGELGPHPGLHLVFLTDRHWSAEDAQRAEAWLVIRFRAELAASGFTGRLSAEHGIDVRPVDDPAGVGRYLTKWGIGHELAGEHAKLGRNATSVPYPAIPSVLAHELGGTSPHWAANRDPRIRRLVDGWADYVRLAVTCRRKWYVGFRRKLKLVPELKDATSDRERIAICTAVLPEELRPDRHDDAEDAEDDEEPGELLRVEPEAWAEAIDAWWRPAELPPVWLRVRQRWAHGPALPLELAISWHAEDHGLAATARAVALLAGGQADDDDVGWTVRTSACP